MMLRTCGKMRGVACGGVTANIDCKTAMHDTSVQLNRLGKTNGEPYRHDAGNNTKESVAGHVSNIGGASAQGRVGPARTIRPKAAISVNSVSGTHSTSQRTVA